MSFAPQRAITAADSPASILPENRLILANAALGALILLLPPPSSVPGQHFVAVKTDVSANTVTLTAQFGATINGETSFVITARYQTVRFYSDGSQWIIAYGSVPAFDPLTELKDYFIVKGILPTTFSIPPFILEQRYTPVARDFEFLNGGALAAKGGALKYTPAGAQPANWGWDTGGLWNRALIIMGGVRARSFNGGVQILKTLPVAPHPSDGYMFNVEPYSGTRSVDLYRNDPGPAEFRLDQELSLTGPDTPDMVFEAIALYCDGIFGIQRCFLKCGNGQWMEPIGGADPTYDHFQYIGMWSASQDHVSPMWYALPFGIYAWSAIA